MDFSIVSPRLIPVVLLSNRRVLKTVKFNDPVYIGDPINTIQIFSDMGADEIMILNIGEAGTSEGIDFEYLLLYQNNSQNMVCHFVTLKQ